MNNQEKMFDGISLTVIPDSEHEWMMSTANVAEGFGVSEETIRGHKKYHSDELLPNKHWVSSVGNSNGGNLTIKATFWTKRGVVRLGFFINSPRAKIFRDWAEDLVLGKLEESVDKLLTPGEMFLQVAQQLLSHEQSIANLQISHEQLSKKVEALSHASEKYSDLNKEVRRIGNLEAKGLNGNAETCIKNLWGRVKENAGLNPRNYYRKIDPSDLSACMDFLKSYELQGWHLGE